MERIFKKLQTLQDNIINLPYVNAQVKSTQDDSGYVEVEGGYSCKQCAAISKEPVKDDLYSCQLIDKDVHRDGCCNLWTKTLPKESTEAKPTPEQTSYIHSKNTSYYCSQCIHFISKDGKCAIVEGKIAPLGSCNFWWPLKENEKDLVTYVEMKNPTKAAQQ